jgi:HlyD family secretion protein
MRIFTIVAVLGAVIAGSVFVAKTLGAAATPIGNQYRIGVIETGTVKKTVTATGTLQAWTTIDIKSRAGGKILKLAVDEGKIVKKGDPIALIDPSDTRLTYNQANADILANKSRVEETQHTLGLQKTQTEVAIKAAEANVLSSRAALASAEARLESAKSTSAAQVPLTEANIDSAKANLHAEEVKLDQLRSATQPQQEAAARAALDEAKANLVNAEANLKRQKNLLNLGFVAPSIVDQAQASYGVDKAALDTAQQKVNTLKPELDADIRAEEARVAQLRAALKTAEANRVQDDLRKQDVKSAMAAVGQARADVAQQVARLQEARAGGENNTIRATQIAQAKASGERSKAALINADIQLKDTQVTAPRAGIILLKYVEEGTIITSGQSFNSSGTSIVQLGDISRMYVDASVDETDIANIDIGQKVDVTFDAYNSTPVDGTVIRMDPTAKVASNVTTLHVRVEVDNSSQIYSLLKPGMNASCDFIIGKKSDVVTVPNEALRSEADGSHYVELPVGGKPAPPEKGQEPDPNLYVDVKIRKQPIEIGLEGNDATEVKSGLKEGDKVVTQTIEPSPPGSTSGMPRMGGGPGPGRR